MEVAVLPPRSPHRPSVLVGCGLVWVGGFAAADAITTTTSRDMQFACLQAS